VSFDESSPSIRLCLFFFHRAIEHQVKQNLDPSILSPYNSIDEYQRFASSLAYSSSAPPNTRASRDGLRITHKEHTLKIPEWRDGVTALVDRITAAIDDLCYHQDFGLTIPDVVPDDWTNGDRGYTWTKNADFLPDKLALLHRMLDDEALKLSEVDNDGKLRLKVGPMWTFLDRCSAINKDLALLTFFGNGQTSRITEFVEHKIENSTCERTCFYDDHSKCLWMVVRRKKTDKKARRESFIPMKCPPITTELLMRYFLIVRPVEAHFAFHIRGTAARNLYKEYMWVQNCELLKKTEFYKMVPEYHKRVLDDEIGIRDYRQIAVEISRVYLGSEMEVQQEEIDVLAAQRGHSLDMAQFRYAREVGHLPGMSSDLLLRFGRISERWWGVIGLLRGLAPLLPLHSRQRLQITTGGTSNQDVAFDPEALLASITESIQTSFHTLKSGLKSEIQEIVAQAIGNLQKGLPVEGSSDRGAQGSRQDLPSHGPNDRIYTNEDFDCIYGDEQVEQVPPPGPPPVVRTAPVQTLRSAGL